MQATYVVVVVMGDEEGIHVSSVRRVKLIFDLWRNIKDNGRVVSFD
jgi:hypothetical protein